MEKRFDNLTFDRAELIWNIQGRLGRWLWFKFTSLYTFLAFIVMAIISLAFFGIINLFLPDLTNIPDYAMIILGCIGLIIYLPIIVLFEIFFIILSIKRLHDMNLSGWWYLLILFIGMLFSLSDTMYGIYYILYFLFFALVPGNKDANEFGEKPLERLRFWKK